MKTRLVIGTFTIASKNSCLSGSFVIGGSRGSAAGAPPPWDPILSFLHMFSPKVPVLEVGAAPNGLVPPNGKFWISNCLWFQAYNHFKFPVGLTLLWNFTRHLLRYKIWKLFETSMSSFSQLW